MTVLQTFLHSLGQGMTLVSECAGMSASELEAVGAPDALADDLAGLAHTYFGKTTFTRYQREARATAYEKGHSLTVLVAIESYARRATDVRTGWRLRAELLAESLDVKAMKKLAARRLRELNAPPEEKQPEPGVTVYKRSGTHWTMAISGPQSAIADMYKKLDKTRAFESVKELFFGGDSTGVRRDGRPELTTHVVLNLEELGALVHRRVGQSGIADDVMLRTTSGALISGAEFVQRTLTDHGFVTLVDPVEGPVNLYRTSRVASAKQRMMAAAENPVCIGPNCRQGADECQIHHIEAWERGGMTNMENLVTMCRYHNGVNDDDPAQPRRGRAERINGTVYWMPAWAEPVWSDPTR